MSTVVKGTEGRQLVVLTDLGSGRSLFGDPGGKATALLGSARTPDGLLILTVAGQRLFSAITQGYLSCVEIRDA